MSKSNGRSLFGLRRQPVAVIEAPVVRNFLRRALIAFFVVTGVAGLLAGVVASSYLHPVLGFLLGILIGVVCGFLAALFIIAWPVLRAFWHWAPEILLGLGFVSGWTSLMQATPLAVSLPVVLVVLGVPAAVGPIRRRIVAFAWCLIVRHRLRLCFAKLVTTDRHGTLPLILPARPTPAGERVWVWLRPGLSIKDLEADGLVNKLAVACWANEVRVMRQGRRYAALIRVDITRREPLADTIVSPLPDIVPDSMPANAPTSPGLPPVGLDLPDVPDDPGTESTAEVTRLRRPRNPRPAPSAEPDGSDYA